MSMIHDSNKRLIQTFDTYPDFTDLKKGDYIIRLQLRHDDAALMDKMKDIPVTVERKLKEPVTVPVYLSNRDAVRDAKGAKTLKERNLYPGRTMMIVVVSCNLLQVDCVSGLPCCLCIPYIQTACEVGLESLAG